MLQQLKSGFSLSYYLQIPSLFQDFPGAVLIPKFWGEALPHQALHQRVKFLRSPKPEKYEKYEFNIGLHLKSIISRVANSVTG